MGSSIGGLQCAAIARCAARRGYQRPMRGLLTSRAGAARRAPRLSSRRSSPARRAGGGAARSRASRPSSPPGGTLDDICGEAGHGAAGEPPLRRLPAPRPGAPAGGRRGRAGPPDGGAGAADDRCGRGAPRRAAVGQPAARPAAPVLMHADSRNQQDGPPTCDSSRRSRPSPRRPSPRRRGPRVQGRRPDHRPPLRHRDAGDGEVGGGLLQRDERRDLRPTASSPSRRRCQGRGPHHRDRRRGRGEDDARRGARDRAGRDGDLRAARAPRHVHGPGRARGRPATRSPRPSSSRPRARCRRLQRRGPQGRGWRTRRGRHGAHEALSAHGRRPRLAAPAGRSNSARARSRASGDIFRAVFATMRTNSSSGCFARSRRSTSAGRRSRSRPRAPASRGCA